MDKIEITLEPEDNNRLLNLCGPLNTNIKEIELRFDVEINQRGNLFNFIGNKKNIVIASQAIKDLYLSTSDDELSIEVLREYLHQPNLLKNESNKSEKELETQLKFKNYQIKTRYQ